MSKTHRPYRTGSEEIDKELERLQRLGNRRSKPRRGQLAPIESDTTKSRLRFTQALEAVSMTPQHS